MKRKELFFYQIKLLFMSFLDSHFERSLKNDTHNVCSGAGAVLRKDLKKILMNRSRVGARDDSIICEYSKSNILVQQHH